MSHGPVETLKPVASVGDPPGCDDDRNCGSEGPPERQNEVGQKSEKDEAQPENFPLHGMILCPAHNAEALLFPLTGTACVRMEAKP